MEVIVVYSNNGIDSGSNSSDSGSNNGIDSGSNSSDSGI